MAEPVLLPVEIWCQIFLYMDGASTRNASAVCRLFFGILRGDERYSGHVILKQINLSQLVMKIKSKEWTWERWPCLKILEIPIQLGYPDYTCAIGEELIRSIKLLNLEQCLSLDKILIFNCAFPLFHGNTFIVRTVCFNPRTIPKTISLEDVAHLEIFRLEDTIAYCLMTIGRLAKKVNSLSIRLESQFYPHQPFLTNEFTPMLAELKSSLTSFSLTICNYSRLDANSYLKALSENCVNLENLYIKDQNADTRQVQFFEHFFPQLKELIVPKLQHISAFVNDAKHFVSLKVENVTTSEFTNFDFSSISMKLKRLKKCEIFVSTNICQDQNDWTKVIDENFQPWTKVVIYQLSVWQSYQTEAVFIKPFYEKTKIVIDFGLWRQRTWNSSLDPALE